jgi:alpha-tubulin suppressor-like RCC1 family protein
VARALHPVAVRLPAGTVDVQGGTDFTVALTDTGQVWTWGSNRYGQLGDGAAINRAAPVRLPVPDAMQVAAGNAGSAALTASGATLIWGRAIPGPAGLGAANLATPRLLTLPKGTTPAMVGAMGADRLRGARLNSGDVPGGPAAGRVPDLWRGLDRVPPRGDR